MNPQLRKDSSDNYPCGRCPMCIKRSISHWSLRLRQHERTSDSAYFITLTYDTNHLSFARQYRKPTLQKKHIQLFFKRVRKAHGKGKDNRGIPIIKYFAVGEYGTKNYRPHYHVILFNANLQELLSVNDQNAVNFYGLDGTLPLKLKQWDYGHVTIGHVTGASVGYTLKYMSKPKRIPQHRNDDRLPEFRLMSKALGLDYIGKQKNWHLADLNERMYCNLDGKKLSMPRYYKERIYDETQRQLVGKYQQQKLQEKQAVEIQDNPNYWWDLTQKINAAYNLMYKKSFINRNL